MSFGDVAYFILGVFLGFVLTTSYWLDAKIGLRFIPSKSALKNFSDLDPVLKVDEKLLADDLFNQVKVMCMVMTYPGNHKTKALHVLKTWGKRCNKIYFVSRALDPDLPIILLDIPDGRSHLWNKTRDAFEYVYKNNLDDADWFMKVDDDSFVVLENLRELLFSYDSNRSMIFGHKYFVEEDFEGGYMAGGAYILSKAAVKKLVEKILPNDEDCREGGDGTEDWGMGRCLTNHAIFIDNRDEKLEKRFFPIGVEPHFEPHTDLSYWYWQRMYFNISQGNLDCCSSSYTQSHYIGPPEMYLLDYLIYNVVPFGIDRNFNETLPQKFSFEEIVRAGRAKSFNQP